MEGCNSPVEVGAIDEREEPGLGCRLVKEAPPWAEELPVGVGCRSPAPPPPGMVVWSKLAAEVGGAEKEESVLEAATKEAG